VQFYILDINGAAPPPGLAGRKDVVLVPSQQTVRFITRFEHFCDTVPYMYHCHMLKHEDEGMIGQFTVQCLNVGLKTNADETSSFQVYPNPAEEFVLFSTGPGIGKRSVRLYDQCGRLVASTESNERNLKLSVNDLASGFYFAEINTEGKTVTRKLAIR
jgi:blue copper oxidase